MRITLISSWFRNWRVFVCYLATNSSCGNFPTHELFMRILLLESFQSRNSLHKVKPVMPIQLSLPCHYQDFPGGGRRHPQKGDFAWKLHGNEENGTQKGKRCFFEILLYLPLIFIVESMFLKHSQSIDHCWKCKSMPLVWRGLTPSFLLILRHNK